MNMRSKFYCWGGVSALLLFPISITAQDAWELLPGIAPAVSPYALTSDGAGNLYAAVLDDNNPGAAVVRLLNDSADWTVIKTLYSPGQTSSQIYCAAVNESDHLAVGGASVNGVGGQGTVLISENPGTASPVFTSFRFGPQSDFLTVCRGVAWTDTGDLYAAGHARQKSTYGLRWVVQRKASGASAFVTEEDIAGSSKGNTSAFSIAFHPPTGDVFAAGGFAEKTGLRRWLVRRRSSTTGLWTTFDTFNFDSRYDSGAFNLAVAPSGAIYVVGYGNDRLGGHWIVRVWDPNGQNPTSFVTSEIFTGGTMATKAAVDCHGKLFVSGRGNDNSSVIRKLSGGDWSTSAVTYGGANLTADPFGTIWSVGNDASGVWRTDFLDLGPCQ